MRVCLHLCACRWVQWLRRRGSPCRSRKRAVSRQSLRRKQHAVGSLRHVNASVSVLRDLDLPFMMLLVCLQQQRTSMGGRTRHEMFILNSSVASLRARLDSEMDSGLLPVGSSTCYIKWKASTTRFNGEISEIALFIPARRKLP